MNQNSVRIASTPTPLCTMQSGRGRTGVRISNHDAAAIYLGGANVSANTGTTRGDILAAGASIEIDLSANDTLYAISPAIVTASVTAITDQGEVAVTAIADDGHSAITSITSDGTSITFVGANNYVVGNHVSVFNATEPTFNIADLPVATCDATQFTVLSAATGATSTADAHTLNKANVVTYTAANAYTAGDLVSIELASSAGYNVIGATVVTASGSQFTISKILNVVGVTSTADARLTNGNLVTYLATNTFVVGDVVTITGATSPEYNVTGVITTCSGSQFTLVTPVLTGVTSTATATRNGTANGAVSVLYS